MKLVMFLIVGFLAILPGVLLIIGASRFKKLIRHPSAVLILLGTIFTLFHLLIQTGTYYFSFLGDAESLANYTLTKSWLSPIAEYVGLVLIAVGLLIFKEK